MKHHGLTAREVEESRKKHGANTLTQIPPDPLWKKILEGFKDPMIMILLVALVVQVVLFFLHQAEWFEPVGILIAIMIANGVSAVSENKQEGKASALKAEEEAKETAKVLRDGKLEEIHVSEVVVGDIVFLQAGDKLPADGEIVEGEVKVDQAALNGETEEAEKRAFPEEMEYDIKDLLNKCYAYRGTVVCGGEAYMEIKVVGDQTCLSPIASLVSIYVGMRLGGVVGMIMGPVVCLVALSILRGGVLDSTFADLRLAMTDIIAILKGGKGKGGNNSKNV